MITITVTYEQLRATAASLGVALCLVFLFTSWWTDRARQWKR